jgi:outer membrane protein assembly factor BamB
MIIRTLLVCFLFSFCLPQLFADWPQWRGPDRNGHVPESHPVPDELPDDPEVLWRLPIGPGLASPVVAEGKVFYLDAHEGKEVVHAIDAANAKTLWSVTLDDTFSDAQGPSGPRCTPVVDGERIYVQSSKGELQCLRVSDGKLVWRVNFTNDFSAIFIGEKGATPGAARHGNTATPLVHGNHLIAKVGGTDGESVVCFDKFTGKVIWKSQDDMAGYAPPVLATLAGVEQIICFTADALIGLDASDGKLLWRIPIKTAFGRHITTPVVVNDMVVVSSHQVGLIGARIVNNNGKMEAEQAWVRKDAAINFSSPVAVGNHLYGLGPKRDLICVEINSGELIWSQQGYFITSGDRSHAGFIVMGSNILGLTDAGELVFFEANPKKFKEISRVQVAGFNWTNPAYCNGKLYLRDGLQQSGGNLLSIRLLNK